MTDWAQLMHAYGAADDIPQFLDRLSAGHESDEIWKALWSSLCHQGDVYSASFAALPSLADIAVAPQQPRGNRLQAVALAAAIVSCDHHAAREESTRYASEFPRLLTVTEELLGDEPGSMVYLHLLQTKLVLEGEPGWAALLETVIDEEFEVECPNCHAGLHVLLGEDSVTSADDEGVLRDEVTGLTMRPASPEALHGIPRRLHGLVHTSAHPQLTEPLSYLFGTITCTECGVRSTVADHVAGLH